MFHANTERMVEYWLSRAEPGRAPSRAMIEPGDFRQLMPQVFILGREAKGQYLMRLAGGFVSDLHRRDLRGVNALTLWSEGDRIRLQTVLEELRNRPEPVVALSEALTDGADLAMEIFLAPLAAHDGGPDRYLGLYQPRALVSRLMGQAVRELRLVSLRRPGAANEHEGPRLKLAAVGGRQVA